MKIKLYILLILSVSAYGWSIAQESQKEVLKLHSDAMEYLSAIPVLDNTVIKFDKDTMIVTKDQRINKINISEVTHLIHSENFKSDLSVSLRVDDDEQLPVANSYVTLHNDYKADPFGIIQVTNDQGVARFKDVPVGYYTLFVNDGDERFHPVLIPYLHQSDNNVDIFVTFDTHTTVSTVTETGEDYPLYNLNGQIVKNPGTGIYIRNGRKIIIK